MAPCRVEITAIAELACGGRRALSHLHRVLDAISFNFACASMQDGVQDINRLFTPPLHVPSDVEMVEGDEPVSLPPLTESSPALSRHTSLAPPEKPPAPYVEVRLLTASERKQYESLAERPITVEDAFPEEEMERIIGEYGAGAALNYYVRMSSGLAFKVRTMNTSPCSFI